MHDLRKVLPREYLRQQRWTRESATRVPDAFRPVCDGERSNSLRWDRNLTVMSRGYFLTLSAILMTAAALMTWSCSPNPTPEDSRRLEQLQQRYGNRYRFELAEDTYIEATNQAEATVKKDEAISIYKDFWFTGNTERRDSHYVYLNLYNKDGDFQFQIFWDRNSGRFVTSNRDHY